MEKNSVSLFSSEKEFTDWLAKKARGKASGLRLGIGDDAALLESRPGFQWVVTADLSVEGVHFSPELHPPDAVGHRALARSLSDVAAMGGTPRFALISVAISKHVTRRWIEAFFTGALRLARRHGVKLVGGDTALNPNPTTVDVLVIGEVRRGRALLRTGAKPGDHIFTAGKLGESAQGLDILRSKARLSSQPARRAVNAHLYPEPQCELGGFLGKSRIASAAIDLSDGLSTDLMRLAEASKAGARIWADRVLAPMGLPGKEQAASALSLALHGGEDYKLLFTVRPSRVKLLPKRFKGAVIYQIGEMQARRSGIQIVQHGRTAPLEPEGYDHFRD